MRSIILALTLCACGDNIHPAIDAGPDAAPPAEYSGDLPTETEPGNGGPNSDACCHDYGLPHGCHIPR